MRWQAKILKIIHIKYMKKDMSITGSLLTYENNNHIVNKSKKKKLSSTTNSVGKMEPSSSNPNISKTDPGIYHKQLQANAYTKSPHLPVKYMNSKRKHTKYNSMYAQMYPDHNNYLHLNSLWSIWYGVLLTLFQGYLAVHGATRFLECSLIPWNIEPVAELNLQIILSGLVFVLLPFFFTSAVFKIGNMANDGNKLGNSARQQLCSMSPHDGLQQESRDGTLRTLWIHGGPTAAFIHILIAMCLLLPRLLLEGRIIENGLLPKETIWKTELDFLTVNRHDLVMLSMKNSAFDNTNYVNTTIFTAHSDNKKNTTDVFENNLDDNKHELVIADKKKNYLELSKSVNATFKPLIYNSNRNITEMITTTPPSFMSTFKSEIASIKPTMPDSKLKSLTTTAAFESDKNYVTTTAYEEIRKSTSESFVSNGSFSSPNVMHTAHNIHHRNHHNGKTTRKQHRQRKITSSSAQRRDHQNYSQHQKSLKSSRRLKDQYPLYNGFSDYSVDFDEFNFPDGSEGLSGGKRYEHRPKTYGAVDYGHARVGLYPKSPSTISTTTRDSNIHIVKPEKLPEIIPSTPLSSNSKIIEIKQKTNNKFKRDIYLAETNHVQIEPEYLVGEFSLNDSSEYIAENNPIELSTTLSIQSDSAEFEATRLTGFAGMLQLFFGVEKPIDVKIFTNPPSAEFINLLFALLVWCARYPAVFWTTAKSFATIFSVQMIASAADIIFSFIGISSLFKLQIYSQGQTIQNLGLILNANVTLGLFLLSVVLILSSSMVLYLYGHGRLSVKMRERSIISLSSNESWTYFAHCASLCYVLALSVVKAPLLNDLNATYRNNLHCPTFMAALVSVMQIFLWIIIWISLTIKRKWSFKLPPLDAYAVIGKATTQPLLMHNSGVSTNITASVNNSTKIGISGSSTSENTDPKVHLGNSGHLLNNMSSSDLLNDTPQDDIYWPKLMPTSPKLKVTFNEVTSTSVDDHHHQLIGEQEQNNGKRNSPSGATVCFASVEGEIDDGEYATLRSGAANIVGIILGGSNTTESNNVFPKSHALAAGVKSLSLREYDELAPPPNMTSSMTVTDHTTTVAVNSGKTYVNCLQNSTSKMFGEDIISEEGKLLERVRDDNVTYASTHDLEPPLAPPHPKMSSTRNNNGSTIFLRNCKQTADSTQFPSSSDYLISPLAPIRVSMHTNEAHVAPSSTYRCLRRADSGVSQEALTPRSDTNSCGTESTTSPPEQAPSESSSGVHSAEEREIEVVIRPRVVMKPLANLTHPAIQEEPNGRCTNMRMSSFAGGVNTTSATLPLQRGNLEQKFDYSQYCSTMPLPLSSYNEQQSHSAMYASSAHCMSQPQSSVSNVSSFKTPLYANSGVAMPVEQHEQCVSPRGPVPLQKQLTHTTLPNGARYSNPSILRRHPFNKASDLQYNYQMLSKSAYESSVINSTIHEDRDSANYSMTSDQESLYATANSLL